MGTTNWISLVKLYIKVEIIKHVFTEKVALMDKLWQQEGVFK